MGSYATVLNTRTRLFTVPAARSPTNFVCNAAWAKSTSRSPSIRSTHNTRRIDSHTHVQEHACQALSSDVSMKQGFTIIGGGRVGQALADMGSGNDVVVRRGEAVPEGEGPIIVCTRNDDLQAVVDGTPPGRRKDLVFIQNGMLQPWLDAQGLGDNTQVLVYFAVAKKGDPPTDGKTDVNPEGLTAACGPHAAAFADRLRAAGLSCKVLPPSEFSKPMLEKLIWISAFMLVGAKHSGCSVGEVEAQHRQEVVSLIQELAAAGSATLGARLDPGVEDRLLAYARSVSHFPTAVKEFGWRNGWFWGLSQAAAAAGKGDPCPTHTALLREVGAV